MAAAIAALDWNAHALGPPANWPDHLKTAVSLMLRAGQPMFIAWGPQRTWLFNDAFLPILGSKAPLALGNAASEVWAEIWSDIGPLFDQVFEGEAVQRADIALML